MSARFIPVTFTLYFNLSSTPEFKITATKNDKRKCFKEETYVKEGGVKQVVNLCSGTVESYLK